MYDTMFLVCTTQKFFIIQNIAVTRGKSHRTLIVTPTHDKKR